MNDVNGHSKQEIEAEFPVKGSELLLFDSSRLWVEVRNCFLVEMSKDQKLQVNEMIEMMKSKQIISPVRNVKQ